MSQAGKFYYRKDKKPKVPADGPKDKKLAWSHPKKRSRSAFEHQSSSSQAKTIASGWNLRLTKAYLLKNGKEHKRTVSIAFPSSILRHTASHEQATVIIGQIARACAIFEVDEIIVFCDSVADQSKDSDKIPSHTICRILQYIETPPYLRKGLFPFHTDFRHIGLIPRLDLPHHVRQDDMSWYREGMVVSSDTSGSQVDIGFTNPVTVSDEIPPKVRITVRIDKSDMEVVSPDTPRRKHGLYWGYQTRLANSFHEIFTTSSFTGDDDEAAAYDLVIGYSDKDSHAAESSYTSLDLGNFSHLLIVFGGEDGVEGCINADESISDDKANRLFHHRLKLCPSAGCRTIRTEDCIFASLARLHSMISLS
jgi:methyltransferase